MRGIIYIIILSVLISCTEQQQKDKLIIGSKKFTESVILANITSQYLSFNNKKNILRPELGGTRILWNALLRGDVDAYPEYTGTILKEILYNSNIMSSGELKDSLMRYGISMTQPLGFNNSYGIGVSQETAKRYSLEKISDLSKFPDLKIGLTNEFLNRKDGWPGLKKIYSLKNQMVRGLDHDLAYQAIGEGAIDVLDVYLTDAEIKYYNLKVLKDDKNYFQKYLAVILYRKSVGNEVASLLNNLSGKFSEEEMIELNSLSKIKRMNEADIAGEFLNEKFNIVVEKKTRNIFKDMLLRTFEHLYLVLISMSLAISISIPLGIFAYKNRKFGQLIINIVNIFQTIPSLALLVLMIPILGIGTQPAIAALFLYSLLPIVRNTFLGFENIPNNLRESALVLGLSNNFILRKIELPMSSASILTGIKTATIINIGTATLGALIGAGGYGQPILTGIRLDDVGLIMQGAIPAALLAIGFQYLFDYLEKIIIPKGLRLN